MIRRAGGSGEQTIHEPDDPGDLATVLPHSQQLEPLLPARGWSDDDEIETSV
jgi:hypothetical protein